MKSVTLSGWNVGMDKVGLTKLLRGEPVTLELADDRAEQIIAKIEALGVKLVIVCDV